MLNSIEVGEEVLYTRDPITTVNEVDIDSLKARASVNRRRRVRLCAHPDVQDALHEMLIVHYKGNYVPPHKHLGKCESFHMIEGALRVVLFDDEGNIRDVIRLDASISEDSFLYYRLFNDVYHTILLTSEVVVFHETTNGPFSEGEVIFPEWAPVDEAIDGYMEELIEPADSWESLKGDMASRHPMDNQLEISQNAAVPPLVNRAEDLHLVQSSEGVWFADSEVVKVGIQEINFLKEQTKLKQCSCRLCIHRNHADVLHEMIIVHARDTYIRPHKHINKSVSFHVIEGVADIVIYDDEGNIIGVIRIGAGLSGNNNLFCRVRSSYYYTQFVRSEYFVFQETTKGPFVKSQIVWAPWAPIQDADESKKAEYMHRLKDALG